MSLFMWIIFGLVVGVIANILDPRPAQGGVIGAIVLGVLGAVLGGFLANLLLGMDVSGFNLSSLLIAVLGSMLVMFVGRAIRKS